MTLQKAIALAGGQKKLAEMLGVRPEAVASWKGFRRGVVPVAQAIAIEKALRGAVTRKELRPDICWDALQTAIALAGGQKKLAERLGLVRESVANWRRRMRGVVPVARAIEIEKALRGAVTRKELRPDVFGPPRAKAKPKLVLRKGGHD